MSVPVLSWLFIACRGRPRRTSSGRLHGARSRSKSGFRPERLPEGLRSARVRPAPSDRSPTDPALRANPFPEVTDLFCRLPLPTLFYRLEAVHLGDLMRLSVRPGARIIRSLGFSRAVESAPDTTTSVVLYRTFDPISSQSDSRVPVR